MLVRRSLRPHVLPFVVAAALLLPAGAASAADTTRPSIPTGLSATATQSSLALRWSAARDNVGVTGYRIYLNGAFRGQTSLLGYTLSALPCGTAFIVMVSAQDAAGNLSLPATIFPRTAACGPAAPACPTPTTVLGLLLEHKIDYGCGWPSGGAAREAVKSIRAFLAARGERLTTRRAKKWLRITLDELDAATATAGAWTAAGAIIPGKEGLSAQYRIGRAIRLLQNSDKQLFEVSKSEKWALAAVSWYIAASQFNAATSAGVDPAVLARAEEDLHRADKDFFDDYIYRAWGRYRTSWQRVTGLL
jgi:hypothetical protein